MMMNFSPILALAQLTLNLMNYTFPFAILSYDEGEIWVVVVVVVLWLWVCSKPVCAIKDIYKYIYFDYYYNVYMYQQVYYSI